MLWEVNLVRGDLVVMQLVMDGVHTRKCRANHPNPGPIGKLHEIQLKLQMMPHDEPLQAEDKKTTVYYEQRMCPLEFVFPTILWIEEQCKPEWKHNYSSWLDVYTLIYLLWIKTKMRNKRLSCYHHTQYRLFKA